MEAVMFPFDPELHLAASLWVGLTRELHARTEGRHESGAFLLGTIDGRRRHVRSIVYYDDLDPDAYASGVVILHGTSFGPLWDACRVQNLQVVADIHVHPGSAHQSQADREHPMIAKTGHLAMILPDMAAGPIRPDRIGLYRYRGRHRWQTLGHHRLARHVKISI
jgi:proteasome lid subunit RPN8/RPN11